MTLHTDDQMLSKLYSSSISHQRMVTAQQVLRQSQLPEFQHGGANLIIQDCEIVLQ